MLSTILSGISFEWIYLIRIFRFMSDIVFLTMAGSSLWLISKEIISKRGLSIDLLLLKMDFMLAIS